MAALLAASKTTVLGLSAKFQDGPEKLNKIQAVYFKLHLHN